MDLPKHVSLIFLFKFAISKKHMTLLKNNFHSLARESIFFSLVKHKMNSTTTKSFLFKYHKTKVFAGKQKKIVKTISYHDFASFESGDGVENDDASDANDVEEVHEDDHEEYHSIS